MSCLCSKIESDDFSDVLDMEYLLLSDASSIVDRNESKNSENNFEYLFLIVLFLIVMVFV